MKNITWTPTHEAIFADVRQRRSAMVVARAGTGKTTTIVRSTAEVSPRERVLLTAFSKSSKLDLEARVSKSLHVATAHSVGLKVIKASPEGMKIEPDMDRLYGIIRGLTPAKLAKEDHEAVKDVVSYAKNVLAKTAHEIEEITFDMDPTTKYLSLAGVADLSWQALQVCKRNDGKVDYDDMIWLPNVWDLSTLKYNVIFVDEAQDINLAQLSLLQRCRADDGRVYAVGDDRQAIYQFRGAAADALTNIRNVFGISQEHLLPISYRCPQAVIEWARKIVPDIQPSPTAPEGIVRERDSYTDASVGDCILSRANRDLVTAHTKLRQAGKPSAILGSKFAGILRGLVRKSKADKVDELLAWLDKHKIDRLEAINEQETDPNDRARRIEEEVDRIESVIAIATGAASIRQVMERIESAFASPSSDAIILSTTHQMKGLEANHIWLIADSYAFYREMFDRRYFYEQGTVPIEEANLAYVATTRAKQELTIVVGTRHIDARGF